MTRITKSRESGELLDLAEQLRDMLSRWVRTTRERTNTPSSAKIETLCMLRDAGALPIAALAQRRLVKHQSMRLVVEQLALEGAVTKSVDPDDRRNQIVRITNQGKAAIRREQGTRTKWIANLLNNCTPAEIDQVEVAIRTLEDLLSRSSAPEQT